MRRGRRPALASSLVAIALGLSGCAGLARGITEGLVGRRLCIHMCSLTLKRMVRLSLKFQGRLKM